MTFKEVCELVPLGRNGKDGGSWAGYYLRSVFAPFIGIEAARVLVVRVLGPGHDHYPIDNHFRNERRPT